MHMDRYTYNLL